MVRNRGRTEHQKKAHWLGLQAEHAAEMYLRVRGYRILAKRYKVPVGEIDLIARSGETVVFVEIKRRRERSEALSSLKPRQMARIVRAAEYWLSENQMNMNTDCRFDMIVFSAYLVPHHIKNAFSGEDAQQA